MVFREENRFLIYSATTFGLHMRSIDLFINSKCLNAFLNVWTKLPIVLIPLYTLMDIRSVVADDMSIVLRFALFRKAFVYFGFFLKNVIFYWNREKIEKLMDLWDDSFKEEFFPEKHLMSRKENQKQNRKIVSASIILAMTAALSYSLPSFFNKKKVMTHPTGIIYPHRSPEFEAAVMFDVCVSLTCVSAALFDSILMVFLSHVRSKLLFLRETLADIINEFVIDDEGTLLGRSTDSQVVPFDADYLERLFPSSQHANDNFRQQQGEFYEERMWKGKEFRKNVKNVEPKLRIWILHHQQTISFFTEVSKVYSSVASFQLGYIVIYTAMTALHVVQLKFSLVVIGTILVACSNLMSLFFWCQISGEVENVDVFADAFGRAWFLFPKKIKTSLSCIVMRSSKRLCLFGFTIYAINLATFFDILKLAYQFFAFMVQMTDKKE